MRGLAKTARWLRNEHAQGALVCGSCSGVSLLGEAGLLKERRCTTTWWLHDEMKRRYPKADAAWGAAILEDRPVISAGGPLSWIDLSLHVMRVLCGAFAHLFHQKCNLLKTRVLSSFRPSLSRQQDCLSLCAFRQNGMIPLMYRMASVPA